MSKIEDALNKANQLRQSRLNAGKYQVPVHSPQLGLCKGKRFWQYSIGISLALVVVFGVQRYAKEAHIPSQPKQPAADVSANLCQDVQHQAPVEASKRNNRLPTSIPLNSPDAAYASAHPGWQRYITKSLEFRVLQGESAVKAIQVLSRLENVITDEYFTSFLGEIAGRDLFKIQSSENKDGYNIERGTAGNTAKVVVYRKMPNGEIEAFVVEYL